MQIDTSSQAVANSHFERRVSLKFLCCITASDKQKLHYPGLCWCVVRKNIVGTCFRARFNIVFSKVMQFLSDGMQYRTTNERGTKIANKD